MMCQLAGDNAMYRYETGGGKEPPKEKKKKQKPRKPNPYVRAHKLRSDAELAEKEWNPKSFIEAVEARTFLTKLAHNAVTLAERKQVMKELAINDAKLKRIQDSNSYDKAIAAE